MNTEFKDPLSAFCEQHISLNSKQWPTSEFELADAFITHFSIPALLDKERLHDFLVRSNIELREDHLPADLLGAHMCFGSKRTILFSADHGDVLFRIHTVLHEIREIIEADFVRLGFGTTGRRHLDSLADEFAFTAYLWSMKASLGRWFQNAAEIDPNWEKWVCCGLLTAGALVMVVQSFVGAYGYRFQNCSVKAQRLKDK